MLNSPFYFCNFPLQIHVRQRSSKSILSSKRLPTSTQSNSCEDSAILTQRKWLRIMHRTRVCMCYHCCTLPLACKGNRIVCCRYKRTQLQVSSVSLMIFALCSPFILHFTWLTAIQLYTSCLGQLNWMALSGVNTNDLYPHSQQMGITFSYHTYISQCFNAFNIPNIS